MKLVRNKIAKKRLASGRDVQILKTKKAKLMSLMAKLQEESAELFMSMKQQSKTGGHLAEVVDELIDVSDVLDATINLLSISRREFDNARQQKHDTKGTFSDFAILIG